VSNGIHREKTAKWELLARLQRSANKITANSKLTLRKVDPKGSLGAADLPFAVQVAHTQNA
jgi:hypothetical protein